MTLQDFRLWNSPWILRSPSPRSPSPRSPSPRLQESRVSASVARVGHCPETCGCQMVAVTWHVTSRSWDSTQNAGRSGRISSFILMIDGKWEMFHQLHSRCLRMWSIMMCRKWWLQDLEITLRFTQLVCWSLKFVDLKKGRNGGKKTICLPRKGSKKMICTLQFIQNLMASMISNDIPQSIPMTQRYDLHQPWIPSD